MTRRIYITGCARSGTTLLCRLFYAFKNVDVIDEEIALPDFLERESDRPILVGKRWVTTLFSNELPPILQARFAYEIAENDVQILNIVRDGRDVVWRPKKGTQVEPARWVASIEQAETWEDHIKLNVRYEDICSHPDETQDVVASAFDLVPIRKWSEYPEFVPASAVQEHMRDLPNYGLRPISTESVGKKCAVDRGRFRDEAEWEKWRETLKRLGYS